jgi:dihydroorotase
MNGIVGIETAFPVLYTCLVEPGIVPLEVILKALCVNPRKIFDLPGGRIAEGEIADVTVLDVNRNDVIDPMKFKSLGRATPFAGWGVTAGIAMTICDGEIVHADLRKQEENA